MGQKVHPVGFRLGVSESWESKWFSRKEYASLLHEDLRIRNYVFKRLPHAAISKIEVGRASDKVHVNLHTARPGIVIGRRGAEVEQLRTELQEMTDKQIFVNIHEVRQPETNAPLVARGVAEQLERRVGFRRAMKRAVSTALNAGAAGIKISCAGRLAGSEIARREWYRQGRVPLQTLRAHIDYGLAEARTKYGVIGVKVWVCPGGERGSSGVEEQPRFRRAPSRRT